MQNSWQKLPNSEHPIKKRFSGSSDNSGYKELQFNVPLAEKIVST